MKGSKETRQTDENDKTSGKGCASYFSVRTRFGISTGFIQKKVTNGCRKLRREISLVPRSDQSFQPLRSISRKEDHCSHSNEKREKKALILWCKLVTIRFSRNQEGEAGLGQNKNIQLNAGKP